MGVKSNQQMQGSLAGIMGPYPTPFGIVLPRSLKASSVKHSNSYPLRRVSVGLVIDQAGREYHWRGRYAEQLVRANKPNSSRDRHRLNVALRKLTKRQRAELALNQS